MLGLQFHLEVDPAVIERWLIANADELAAHDIEPHRLREEAERWGPALAVHGPAVFEAWLDGLPA